MRTLSRGLALTFSLTSLMTGISILTLLGVNWLCEELFENDWVGYDRWLMLTLPFGGSVGLALGLRYRARLWPHLAGVLVLAFTLAIIVEMYLTSSSQPPGLGRGLAMVMTDAVVYTTLLTG